MSATKIETIQLHWKFLKLFGGDPVFELAVLKHFNKVCGTDSLLRIPDDVIRDANNHPLAFRLKVNELKP